jgi:alpha-ketoglutaric semialdehyde dehydrogenase
VVLKPSELTPLSAVNFIKVLDEAGVPPGVVNMVTGGPAVGETLTTHRDVAVVSFTGSTAVGKLVNQNAAPFFKKVHLEMGGKNAIMIMDDANLDLALEGCLWGGFGTTGQRCTAASRVIVHEKVHDRFVEQFVARAKALRVGDGLDASTQMGPSISDKQLQKVMSYVDIGRQEGATIACGGRRLNEGDWQHGFFHEPTVFTNVTPSMRIAREEIFGPVVSVIKCKGADEAVAITNDVVYGLSASIYTQDINRAFKAMRDVYTGIFYVNAPTIGAEVHLPFGGTKATGNGHREAGTQVLDIFTEWKSVYVDYSGKLQRAQIDEVQFE